MSTHWGVSQIRKTCTLVQVFLKVLILFDLSRFLVIVVSENPQQAQKYLT